ncbi:DMT family transporter, partial [Candidatus Margulisiibacteriota bacterium]
MKINPYFEIFLATLIWGINGVFIKLIHLPAHILSIIRLIVPIIILIFYFWHKKQNVLSKCNKTLVLVSFLNIIRLGLYYVAFIYTSISNAVILLFTWPIFAAILAGFWLKEKIEARTIGLFGLAFLGIIIIQMKEPISLADKDFIGILAALGSAILTAVTVVVFKKQSANITHFESIFYLNFFGAIAALPFIWLIPLHASVTQVFLTIIYALL